MTDHNVEREWIRVAHVSEVPEGRVKSVLAGRKTLALVHFDGQWAAMDNKCPHQGGPLGEGNIEKGVDGQCWLRCPWHGWDFDPLTGKPPGGHADTGQEMFPVEVRGEEVFVAMTPAPEPVRTAMDAMAETFVAWGLKRVFGMVGHSNLGLADALRLREEAGEMSYVAIRHEGAASFACSGYAKLSGKPAACLSIAGPGATNMLTGAWDAKMDRAPLIALTGQVQVQFFGPGAFQDIDLASAYAPVAQFSHTVLHTSDHSELAALAMKNAIQKRDVAHLIFPDDVQSLPASQTPIHGPQGRLSPSSRIGPPEEAMNGALDAIARSQRPIIIVGYGAREAMDEIIALAEDLRAPVLTTFKAKGQIGDDHPHAAGVLGRSGTPIASWFMNECDLILAFGSSFSNHTGIAPNKPIIQVDFDETQLGRFHPVHVPVWGEVARTAEILRDLLPARPTAVDQTPEIRERWAFWRDEKRARLKEERGQGVSAAAVFDALTRHSPDNAVLCADVGNNAYSFGRYFEPKHGQRVLLSGYLGSIGFAFPAAMGAWAATQDWDEHAGRKVIAVAGDGGFAQYAMEFTTAVQFGMDITLVLLNNNELAKISKEQREGEWPVWQTNLVNPNFAAFARACGGKGARVGSAEDLDTVFKAAFAEKGPMIIECVQDVELI